nr:MazG-like family protein [Syntrophobotulus glycolicus]
MDQVKVDIAKCSRVIEELKGEIMKNLWLFQQGTLRASESEMINSLGGIVGSCYVLTRRFGFEFSDLDRMLYNKMEEWQAGDKLNLESEWGDLSLLLEYLLPNEK